jgi:hypothetical protein
LYGYEVRDQNRKLTECVVGIADDAS